MRTSFLPLWPPCRHGAPGYIINDIVRPLASASIPSQLEPPALFRDDGKRPDGMTIAPCCGNRTNRLGLRKQGPSASIRRQIFVNASERREETVSGRVRPEAPEIVAFN
ncbi:jg9334 [Pararge aegeria aegeria]|uniref:Jg9334 protein n=1 Tax=Pararge aegeria aegeria TaxID=348720 RepID=A0A8S4S1B4_9NEOP|nr:jg9334 [Pararge aegeria aegeria]